ncbi:MAG: aldo/keto reductase [Chitinivibrionales bacterium]|nr:aldo/keto reductase [Chitinivibrionales bacterium]
MEYRTIAQSDLRISVIGLGTWALGGLQWEEGGISSGWTPVDTAAAREAIAYAIDQGINHFDTADVYGRGSAERLLGTCLETRRDDIYIASKVGWLAGNGNHPYDPRHIRRQCEQSLSNLKRDHLDIYYFHRADFGENDRYCDDAVATMEQLKKEGKIRLMGLCAYTQRDFCRLIPKIHPRVVQTWAHAMDSRFIAKGSPLMKLCQTEDISFIAFSPLNQGILMGKYHSNAVPQFPDGDHRRQCAKFKARYLAKAEKALEKSALLFGNTAEDRSRVALHFILNHRHVAGVIPGFRNVEQVQTHCNALEQPLSPQEFCQVQRLFENFRKKNS